MANIRVRGDSFNFKYRINYKIATSEGTVIQKGRRYSNKSSVMNIVANSRKDT